MLGEDNDLAKCELGLEKTRDAITNAEIFLTMWKGIYDLVYHIKDSRIAEKMLERAVLVGCSDNSELREVFKSPKKISELYDEKLLEWLQEIPGFPKESAQSIMRKRDLFLEEYDKELTVESFPKISQNLLEALRPSDVSETAFEMSVKTCDELKKQHHEIICDIVKSRAPPPIHIAEKDPHGDPIELKSKSPIVGSIKERISLKAYIHPSLQKKLDEKGLHKIIEGLVASW